MPLNRDYIGRRYESEGTFEVSREVIRRFAQAIGDDNPAYTDREAARALGHPDVIAPPTFMTTVTMSLPGPSPVFDPGLGLDYSLVVHGEQKFIHHRPARPGDELRAITTVEDIRDAGSNELMTLRVEIRTTADELVCEAVNVVVSRGTAAGASKP